MPLLYILSPALLKVQWIYIQSVQFSCSVMSDSLWYHGLQHVRPPCPSPTPGVYPNSCPLSRWCHPTISSSVVPFSSCLQSFPTSGSFQIYIWIFWIYIRSLYFMVYILHSPSPIFFSSHDCIFHSFLWPIVVLHLLHVFLKVNLNLF